MLGRRRLRIKALQLLYAYASEACPLDRLRKASFFDDFLSRSYQLYLYQFHFLVRLGDYVVEYYEDTTRLPEEFRPQGVERHLRLHANPVLAFIREHPQFIEHSRRFHVRWQGDDQVIKRVFLDLKTSQAYGEYIRAADPDLAGHLKILQYILKHYPLHFAHLEAHMDETFLNWEDDRDLAVQAAQRSLKRAAVSEDFLWYPYVEEENERFAHQLLVGAATQGEQLIQQWVLPHVDEKKFQFQTPWVDRLILQLAMQEMTAFAPPMQVLINEYVYLARRYGHLNSAAFVNGVLDSIYQTQTGRQKRFRKKGASYEKP